MQKARNQGWKSRTRPLLGSRLIVAKFFGVPLWYFFSYNVINQYVACGVIVPFGKNVTEPYL